MRGLYIHIPFCVSKCAYCDFASYTCYNNPSFYTKYLNALFKEAALYPQIKNIDTLYIGGGTPSVLSPQQMEFLFNQIQNLYGKIKDLKESTFEANPESLNEQKLKVLKTFGFTRLSLGMQTTADKHLKLIGRAHTRQQFFDVFNLARNYFDNINIDIIAALPQQTMADFKTVITEVLALNPAHISIYGLQVEADTPLYKTGFKADDDLMRNMLEYTFTALGTSGYNQYETSNYALKNKESLHNINYWDSGEYLGLGAAAASYIKGVRSQNNADVKEYLAAVEQAQKPTCFEEKLEGKAKIGERVIMGLRKTQGLQLTDDILHNFSPAINIMIAQNLLQISDNFLQLTKEGKYLANIVCRNFVEPFD